MIIYVSCVFFFFFPSPKEPNLLVFGGAGLTKDESAVFFSFWLIKKRCKKAGVGSAYWSGTISWYVYDTIA